MPPKRRQSSAPATRNISLIALIDAQEDQLTDGLTSIKTMATQKLRQELPELILVVCGLQGRQIEDIKDLEELLESEQAPNLSSNYTFVGKDAQEKAQINLRRTINTLLEQNRQREGHLQVIEVWLRALSQCRIRPIRTNAVYLACTIATSLSEKYATTSQRYSETANALLRQCQRLYKEVLADRLKDIYIEIRDQCRSCFLRVSEKTKHDFLTPELLEGVFRTLVVDMSPKIVEETLSLFLEIHSSVKDEKLHCKTFEKFLTSQTSTFEDYALMAQIRNQSSMKLLAILSMNTHYKIPRDLISQIFSGHAHRHSIQGLNTAVKLFYANIGVQQETTGSCPAAIVGLFQLIQTVNSNRLIEPILSAFMKCEQYDSLKILQLEDMLLMLINQSYSQDGNEESLQLDSKQALIRLITYYCGFLKQVTTADRRTEVEHQLRLYNQHILVNSKEFIFESVVPCVDQPIAACYLSLFSNLHTPFLDGSLVTYCDFLVGRCVSIWRHQQATCVPVLKEIVSTVFSLTGKIDSLFEALSSNDALTIFKACLLLGKASIPSLKLESIAQLLHSEQTNGIYRLDLLLGLFYLHQWHYNTLLKEPNQFNLSVFVQVRDRTAEQLVFLLGCDFIHPVVKLSAFKVLCRVLSEAVTDIPCLMYQLPENLLSHMVGYLSNQLGLGCLDETNISSMMHNLPSQLHESQDQTLRCLFELLERCHRYAFKPEIARIVLQIFLRQTQESQGLYKQNGFVNRLFGKLGQLEKSTSYSNKFVFWRLFDEILKQAKGMFVRQDGALNVSSGVINQSHSMTARKLPRQLLDLSHVGTVGIYLQEFVKSILTSYYSCSKRLTPTEKHTLSNKLLLYVVGQLDKAFQSFDFTLVPVFQCLLWRSRLRLGQETIHRVSQFLNGKMTDRHIQASAQMASLWKTIGRLTKSEGSGATKTKRRAVQQQQKESDDDEMDEGPIGEEDRDQQQPMGESRRQTRSATKGRILY